MRHIYFSKSHKLIIIRVIQVNQMLLSIKKVKSSMFFNNLLIPTGCAITTIKHGLLYQYTVYHYTKIK